MWWTACWPMAWIMGPVMMVLIVVFCVAMMSMMMRRPVGRADALGTEVGTRVGPWRGLATADRPQSSTAFEEYRQEALQRLEQEEGAFRQFLEQLRRAKDKTEFDQFMAQRRGSAATAS
jgi:hypothetical protein